MLSGVKTILVVSTILKLLLIPSYRSTDFDVHRNWLRITHDKPLSEWYYDDVSEWTLDYPPFFAYFEKSLSFFAALYDKAIFDITQKDLWNAVVFQRLSGIASEIVLALALYGYVKPLQTSSNAKLAIFASILMHPGFIFVDHIHFQYNGMLFGIFIATIQRHLTAAIAFAVLLNFKHIFVYVAPPIFILLLRIYCFKQEQFRMDRFVQLGLIVASVCMLSFGPFLATSGVQGVQQIFARLFPFQRGLNHAYWAPNVWAIYSAADRVLIQYYRLKGLTVMESALISTSRGLVGDTRFGVLPNIDPRTSFVLVAALNIIFALRLWRKPAFGTFLQSLTLSAMASFMFGWHVHEKACLLFLIPLLSVFPIYRIGLNINSFLGSQDSKHLRMSLVASAAGVYSLFPLLILPDETPFKVAYFLLWITATFASLGGSLAWPAQSKVGNSIIIAENVYIAGLLPLYFLTDVVMPLFLKSDTTAFLPLLLTSVYCAFGNIWTFLRLSQAYFS